MFTARNFTVSRRTFILTEQGQVTDRYTKAIEQLGSDKLDVRIGGIYALERVARDSKRDHPTIIEVLSAFIREHSRENVPGGDTNIEREMRPDVAAALTVIARRNHLNDREIINLNDADLPNAMLKRVNLSGGDFVGTRFTNSDLTMADFRGANLAVAKLIAVSLTRACLIGTDLRWANLAQADLSGTDLTDARLQGADLGESGLEGANLTRADSPARTSRRRTSRMPFSRARSSLPRTSRACAGR